MITPFDFIERLRAWFFAKDRDITLQSGRTIVVSSPGVSVTINSSGVVVTGGDVTIDGSSVAIAGSISHDTDLTDVSADDHHARSHALDSASDHTGTLPWADLNKTGSDLADLAARSHSDLTGVTADQHHNESHTVASHSDTSATGSELNTLTDGSDASSLHDHDGRYFQESEFTDTPGSNSKPLESNSSGELTLVRILASDDGRFGGGLVLGSTSTNPAGGEILLPTISSPGTPSSGYGSLYVNTSNNLVYRDKDGNAWTLNHA